MGLLLSDFAAHSGLSCRSYERAYLFGKILKIPDYNLLFLENLIDYRDFSVVRLLINQLPLYIYCKHTQPMCLITFDSIIFLLEKIVCSVLRCDLIVDKNQNLHVIGEHEIQIIQRWITYSIVQYKKSINTNL